MRFKVEIIEKYKMCNPAGQIRKVENCYEIGLYGHQIQEIEARGKRLVRHDPLQRWRLPVRSWSIQKWPFPFCFPQYSKFDLSLLSKVDSSKSIWIEYYPTNYSTAPIGIQQQSHQGLRYKDVWDPKFDLVKAKTKRETCVPMWNLQKDIQRSKNTS